MLVYLFPATLGWLKSLIKKGELIDGKEEALLKETTQPEPLILYMSKYLKRYNLKYFHLSHYLSQNEATQW